MRTLAIRFLDRWNQLGRYFELRRSARRTRDELVGRLVQRRFARRLGPIPDGYRIVTDDRRWFVSRCVDTVRSFELRDANLIRLAAILEDADVDFFVVPTGSQFRTAIGVHAGERRRAIDALVAHESDPNWYALTSDHHGAVLPFAARDRSSWSSEADACLVIATFSVVAARNGSGTLGRDYRCDLQFWHGRSEEADREAGERATDASGSLHGSGSTQDKWILSPTRNQFVHSMPYKRALEGSTIVGGRRIPTAPEFDWYLTGARCPFPIDLVYTWVDGDDPIWRTRRDRALGGAADLSIDGPTPERYRSFDELRYSLRSVWEHVPYYRRIFLVTDRQVPTWLDVDDPRITIVDHAEIFSDLSALPTFNSHAIESQLHHIEGLSDHYLYLNDDVFFASTSDWSTYFDRSGLSHFFPSRARFAFGDPHDFATSVDNAGKNLQNLLFDEMGWAPHTKIKHTPHAQQRNLMIELEQRFDEAFEQTMNARFRSTSDVSFAAALHHRYGEAVGRATPGAIRYEYLNLKVDNIADRLSRLIDSPCDTMCLNDGALSLREHEIVKPLVERFLRCRFPYAAPWERDNPNPRSRRRCADARDQAGGERIDAIDQRASSTR